MKAFRWWLKAGLFLAWSGVTLLCGVSSSAQTVGSDDPPVVTIRATTPLANATNRPGVFTVFRTGDTNAALDVRYQVAMNAFYDDYRQATNGVDFATISGSVTIPAGAISNSILIRPLANPTTNVVKSVVLELSTPTAAMGYAIAPPETAVVFLTGRTNFPPTVSIASPRENQAYTAPATIPIFADAYDWYGSVRTIEFFAGTNGLGVSTNAQIVWTNVSAGQYTLTAVATADNGTATSAPVNIVVRASPPPTNLPPTASIVAPINGEVFLTNMDISIGVPAFDLDGSVASVEIFAGTNSLGFAKPSFQFAIPAAGFPFPSSPGYTLTWSQPPPGDYELTAVATDDGGATATSAPVNITVLAGPPPANLPPFVKITWPTNGETFATPTSISLSDFAGDVDGQVTSVEFFAGTNELGNTSIPRGIPGGPFTWMLLWTNPPAGAYALTAVATDNSGLSTTSAPVKIMVENSPPPSVPVVSVWATQPFATTNHPGAFTVFRHGNTNATLNVWYELDGTASNGVDYALIPPHWVTITAGATSNTIVIAPLTNRPPPSAVKTVVLTLTSSPLMTPVNYEIGVPSRAVVYIEGTNPPPFRRLTIYKPKDGAVFYTPTNIQIVANSVGYGPAPTNIEFFTGTNDLGAGMIEPSTAMFIPEYGWNLAAHLTWTNPAAGQYPLTAVADFSSGISLTSGPVNVTVLEGPPPNRPPIVTISSPSNGQKFTAPTDIPVLAPAYDPDGLVTAVAFFANNHQLGTFTNPPPPPPGSEIPAVVPHFLWTNAPAGNYALTAVATDDGGLTATSAPVKIAVIAAPPPTNHPPVARIISPPNGAVFRAPINLPLFAFFTYPHGPGDWSSVGFYDGTNFLGLAHPVSTPTPLPPPPDGPAPGPVPVPPTALSTNIYELLWSNAPVGRHVLTAEAEEGNSNNFAIWRIVSAPVNITILPSPPPRTNRPPVVSIVATDPVAVEDTNAWVWRGETNSSPTWAAWPSPVCRFFTNSGPKTATLTVRRHGDLSNDLTVAYDIGGTASNGVDYVTLPGSVTIPAGERRALISIVPIDDGPPDVNKTVVLALAASTNTPPDYRIGWQRRAAAIIVDRGLRPMAANLMPDGCFRLALPGPDAAWFYIEYSTNLTDWTPICTNQVINGSIDFVDPNAPGSQSRFYRAVPLTNSPSE